MKKNFTNSDIFNSYIELAEKNGLVSLAQTVEDSKKALDKNPRADSLTEERIEKLYNVKPDAGKGMDYKKNIGEIAHTKPAVVAPAYDKLNTFVKSDNERQNILLHIVNKRTNGLLTQHKYAQEEMARALVRIANDMDNRNEDDLRALADECLEGFTKEAWSWSELISGSDVPSFLRPYVSAVRIDAPAAVVGALIGAIIGSPAPGVGTIAGAIAGAGTGAKVGALIGLGLGPFISALWGQAPSVRDMSENSGYVIENIKDILPYTHGDEKDYLQTFLTELEELNSLSNEFYKGTKKLKTEDHANGTITESDISSVTNSSHGLNEKIVKIEQLIEEYYSKHVDIQTQYERSKEIGAKERTAREWFSPLISSLNPPLKLKDSVISLEDSIGNYMNSKMNSGERAKYKLDKYYNKYVQKFNELIESNKKEKNSDGEKSSPTELLSSLVQPASNDNNMTPEQKAAARRIVEFIKNS